MRLWFAVHSGICHASAIQKKKKRIAKIRVSRAKSTVIQFILSKKLQIYS